MKRHTRGSKLFCFEHILANPTKKLLTVQRQPLLTQHKLSFFFFCLCFLLFYEVPSQLTLMASQILKGKVTAGENDRRLSNKKKALKSLYRPRK